MRELIYEGPRSLIWRESDDARLREPSDAVVRPFAVALCDLDHYVVRGETPFPAPFPLGHECVARVVAVGESVRSVRPGDVVVVPFQIACGRCAPCLRGWTAHCANVPVRTAMFGFGSTGGNFGGVLADLVRVPFADAMLVAVPPGVDPLALASCSDNLVDGWRTVAPFLAEEPEAPVLIVGGALHSVGLYAAACAVALGAARVDYIDTDPDRLGRAERVGAHALEGYGGKAKPAYPITVDASNDPRGLRYALGSTANEGTCFVASMYFGEATPVPLYPMYVRGITLRTGRVHARPSIPAVLALVAEGRLAPGLITSRVVAWDDAPQAILEGTPAKMIVARSNE